MTTTPATGSSVCVIGSGPAGLITAHVLVQDGFRDMQVLTRDASPGGVWSRERMYPSVVVNNVHGEYCFSPLPIPPSVLADKRVSGIETQAYMEQFADIFLKGHIQYNIEVLKVHRDDGSGIWSVDVLDKKTSTRKVLTYDKVVVCTGGCSSPFIPDSLSPASDKNSGFFGPVIHSSEFAQKAEEIINAAEGASDDDFNIVVVGGGKSAQDICVRLAQEKLPVTLVLDTPNAVVAAPFALPDFIRRSRLGDKPDGAPYSPQNKNRAFPSYNLAGEQDCPWVLECPANVLALSIPPDSPLRQSTSLFWSTRANDEGTPRKDGFYSLINSGSIKLAAPERVSGYGEDGQSIILNSGTKVKASIVIYATGFQSSWSGLFDGHTEERLGLSGREWYPQPATDEWSSYKTLDDPPEIQKDVIDPQIYRGIVPARNIARADFAINGSIFSAHSACTYEVTAHWISSYFLGDLKYLPSSTEEALTHTARNAAWIRKRYPGVLYKINESFTSDIVFWAWPQQMDDLREDMGVMGANDPWNWLTWPFKVVGVDDLKDLKRQRETAREQKHYDVAQDGGSSKRSTTVVTVTPEDANDDDASLGAGTSCKE
ncbi:FAD/NAD(P)-binding domain-containing protein [Coniophora puteana RWD-64-598 SS2]|uniref:FAD/NAD(P)-binding domain-containing protein n=1 Tax=Coniophora puteana (strain RWD-64-598) TaxID=741705 RepID=A0A5M3ME33_CONPW|nr:FAD/NAD(P)-binding domain-containing protein [Coniophora puteana RWD-64-598 SS2]EIW77403.1 FAD/NAD(P)-binding domain-containing protein [Coniophora puteana RWD-64-598 SS2]